MREIVANGCRPIPCGAWIVEPHNQNALLEPIVNERINWGDGPRPGLSYESVQVGAFLRVLAILLFRPKMEEPR
jgi:hypothetical protein